MDTWTIVLSSTGPTELHSMRTCWSTLHGWRKKKKLLSLRTPRSAHTYNTYNKHVDTYNKHLCDLIEKYKTHKASEVVDTGKVIFAKWLYLCCALNKCCKTKCNLSANPDESPKQFLSDIFSVHRQIVEVQKYFSDLQKNFAVLTDQLGTFKVPRNWIVIIVYLRLGYSTLGCAEACMN